MPKISLVIPTFNSASTLQDTIESIRKQNWQNIEVVIIDGASTDGTLAIVDSNRDIVTSLASAPDLGIYDAINKGIARATGTLIGVIGSDDQLIDNTLSIVATKWMERHTDIIAGGALLISNDGSHEARSDENFGPGALLSGIPFCHNAMFVTNETYQRVGKYDLKYRICADADWVHRAIKMDCTCTYIDTPLVRFSLGGTSSNDAQKIMAETYQVIIESFPGLNKSDAEGLFRAVRGWSSGNDVEAILQRNSENVPLLHAATAAFRQHTNLTIPVPRLSTPLNNKDARFRRAFRHLLKILSKSPR